MPARRLSSMAAIGAPDPSQPPRLVGEVLGTGQILKDIVRNLSDKFRFTREDGGGLSL